MHSTSSRRSRSGGVWRALGALLVLETLFAGWALYVTIAGAFGAKDPVLQIASIIIMVVVAAAWVAITAFGAVRSRAGWVRGSSLTIHVLLFATATGILQLSLGPWQLGFGLAAVALIGFVLSILAKPETGEGETRDGGTKVSA